MKGKKSQKEETKEAALTNEEAKDTQAKKTKKKNPINIKKLVVAAFLVAIAVVLSGFSFPIGASRCYPIQHLCNVIAAVFLGPGYALGMAFCASAIRFMMGTGTLLAFPGSMVGAWLGGFLYKKFGKLFTAYIGEIFGTGILGALICYPIATLLMGKDAALFTYVIPFLISTSVGTAFAAVILAALYKSGALAYLKRLLETGVKKHAAKP